MSNTMDQMPAPKPSEKIAPLEQMKQLAHDYQVPISEGTLQQIAGTKGGAAENKLPAFEEYIKTTAQGLYPTMAKQIAAGIPTAYLLEPYRHVGKQILGEDFEPDFIGDSRHAKALTGNIDPATGRPAPMSLSEWGEHLRTEPTLGWHNTPDGQRQTNEVLENIHKAFTEGPAQ